MKKTFNIYISEEKIEELRARAKAQDIPVSTYIKSKLFSEKTDFEKDLERENKESYRLMQSMGGAV